MCYNAELTRASTNWALASNPNVQQLDSVEFVEIYKEEERPGSNVKQSILPISKTHHADDRFTGKSKDAFIIMDQEIVA
jgi:hypothetical protein